MNVKTRVLTFLLVLAAGLSFPATVAAQRQGVPEYRGQKELDVIAICYFQDFLGKGKTVSLEYVTQVNIRDRQALSKEVNEVWGDFRSEAERVGAKRAMINPNSSKTKGISTTFVFEINSEGHWARTPAPKQPTK